MRFWKNTLRASCSSERRSSPSAPARPRWSIRSVISTRANCGCAGVNIAEYAWGTCNNHVPRRDRKLLLTARELDKLQRASQDKGLTIVGLRLFLNERGLAKVVVGLARGRKSYDKREYLKENDARREMDKAMKNYR